MNLLLALLFVTAEIHSVPYGAKLVITGHNYWVGAIAYSADGKLIVTGGGDGEIYAWDAKTGAFVRALHKHLSNVTDIEAAQHRLCCQRCRRWLLGYMEHQDGTDRVPIGSRVSHNILCLLS